MSKDSSIKVYAENFSGSDKPVNAIPVWIENASDIPGGGGGSFDPTYLSAQIDNKLNKNEVGFRNYFGTNYVSGVSGKKLFSDKATSASKSYEAEYASTANYDSNGNYLSQTHDDLTALNSFVQANSAQWAQGGGSDANANVLFRKYYSYNPDDYTTTRNYYVSGAEALDFECAVYGEQQPQEIIITRNGDEITRVYWTQVSSNGSNTFYTGNCIVSPNDEYGINTNGGSYSYCHMSANGCVADPVGYNKFDCSQDRVVKINVTGYNITGEIRGYNGQQTIPLTSFTGSLIDFTAKGYLSYDILNIRAENSYIDYNYNVSAEFVNDGGSTVTSGDVFPPTDSLATGSKYYLAWNTNNGGLYWEHVGN